MIRVRHGKRVAVKCLVMSLALASGAIPEETLAQRIGIFFDPEAQTCSKQIGLYEYGFIWIIAFDLDQTRGPVVGAEFGISGYPSDWYRIITCPAGCIPIFPAPLAANIILGYKEPLPESGNAITLGRIEYTAISEVPRTTLKVAPRAGSVFETPILIQRVEVSGCAGASTFQFLVVPATGSLAVINGECSISVESMSWQRIKSLYRE